MMLKRRYKKFDQLTRKEVEDKKSIRIKKVTISSDF